MAHGHKDTTWANMYSVPSQVNKSAPEEEGEDGVGEVSAP